MEILSEWAYPVSVLIGCSLAKCALRHPGSPHAQPARTELIFDLVGQPYAEVISYNSSDGAHYAGWVLSGQQLWASPEIRGGFHVLLSELATGVTIHHEFQYGRGYEPVAKESAIPIHATRRIRSRRGL